MYSSLSLLLFQELRKLIHRHNIYVKRQREKQKLKKLGYQKLMKRQKRLKLYAKEVALALQESRKKQEKGFGFLKKDKGLLFAASMYLSLEILSFYWGWNRYVK